MYHLRHLDVYDGADQVATVVSLVLAPLLVVVGAVLVSRREPRAATG